jgi:hypothetical protein
VISAPDIELSTPGSPIEEVAGATPPGPTVIVYCVPGDKVKTLSVSVPPPEVSEAYLIL